jgi:hypothetical protein
MSRMSSERDAHMEKQQSRKSETTDARSKPEVSGTSQKLEKLERQLAHVRHMLWQYSKNQYAYRDYHKLMLEIKNAIAVEREQILQNKE